MVGDRVSGQALRRGVMNGATDGGGGGRRSVWEKVGVGAGAGAGWGGVG